MPLDMDQDMFPWTDVQDLETSLLACVHQLLFYMLLIEVV